MARKKGKRKPPMTNKPSDKAKRLERRMAVAELLLAEKSYQRIADELDCAKSTVARDVNWLLEQWQDEAIQDVRKAAILELRRIGQIQERLHVKFMEDGDLTSLDRWIKLHERRAKILGLDRPVDLVVNINMADLDDDQIKRLAAGEDVLSVIRRGSS